MYALVIYLHIECNIKSLNTYTTVVVFRRIRLAKQVYYRTLVVRAFSVSATTAVLLYSCCCIFLFFLLSHVFQRGNNHNNIIITLYSDLVSVPFVLYLAKRLLNAGINICIQQFIYEILWNYSAL